MTEPANSIIHQSFNSSEAAEPLNGDGFGLAWYVPDLSPEPALFKDITPAWNNLNLLNLARVVRSRCVLAHVRAATPGLPVIQLNCHPFASGPFSFMHNGRVGGFKAIRREIIRRLSDQAFASISGSTDSEHLFAMFQDNLRLQPVDVPPAEAMAVALAATIRDVVGITREAGTGESSYLNLAVTDGKRAVVSRYNSHKAEEANSLYVHSGACFICRNGAVEMLSQGMGCNAVLVASEPLTDKRDWQKVEPDHMVIVHEDLRVEMRALAP